MRFHSIEDSFSEGCGVEHFPTPFINVVCKTPAMEKKSTPEDVIELHLRHAKSDYKTGLKKVEATGMKFLSGRIVATRRNGILMKMFKQKLAYRVYMRWYGHTIGASFGTFIEAMLKPFTDVPFESNMVANSFELYKIPIVEISFESTTVPTMFELSNVTNIFEPKHIECPFALFTFFKVFDSSTILKSFKLCTKLETFALWSIANSFELHASVEKLAPSSVGKSFVSSTVPRLHDDTTTLFEGGNVANINLMKWTERHSPTSLLRPSISTNIILTAHMLCKWLSRSSKVQAIETI
uniref:Uncharacterized protein n=1 Tax=Timema bartmani TaxID=61472 RepID=A0A7R9EUY9_9NEOP|nr:unnamed protein product [Timema bartmani]